MKSWLNKVRAVRSGFLSTPSRRYPLYLFLLVAVLLLVYFLRIVPASKASYLEERFRALAFGSDELSRASTNFLNVLSKEVKLEEGEKTKKTDKHILPTIEHLNYDESALWIQCQSSNSKKKGQTLLYLTPEQTLRMDHVADLTVDPRDLCLDINFGDIIDKVFGSNTKQFDSIALALSDGQVVYQQSHNGFRLSNIGNLLQSAFEPRSNDASSAVTTRTSSSEGSTPSPPDSISNLNRLYSEAAHWREISYSTILDAELEGEPYKLLVQPVPLPLPVYSDETRTDQRLNLVLIGIVSSEHMAAAARRPSLPAVSSLVVTLLLTLLILWPVLKIWKMGPTDGFKSTELAWLFFSLLASMALVTVLTINLIAKSDDKDIDLTLDGLQIEIDQHLSRELSVILSTIDAASHSSILARDLKILDQHASPNGKDEPELVPEAGILDQQTGVGRGLFDKYPWIDQIFWTNSKGLQLVKWSVREKTTQQSSIARYPFFGQLQTREMWTLEQLTEPAKRLSPGLGATPTGFLLAPIFSPNTGEYIPLVVTEFNQAARPHGNRIAAVAVNSPLLSIYSPILPPHCGFALIDETGTVQFHSDAARSGRENMLHSLNPSDAIERALSERGEQRFTASYAGSDVRVLARPLVGIKGSNWILVTWYRLGSHDRFVVDMLTCTMLCLTVYFLYLCLLAGIIRLLARRGRTLVPLQQMRNLWYLPSPETIPNVLLLILVLCGLFAIDVFLIERREATLGIWIGIALNPLVITTTIIVALRLRVTQLTRLLDRWRRFAPHLCLLAVSIATVLLGCVSTIAFTKLSWDYLRVSYSQLDAIELVDALRNRDHIIRDRAEKIALNGHIDDLVLRGEREDWDRYDSMLFNRSDIRPNPSERVDGWRLESGPASTQARIEWQRDEHPMCRPGEEVVVCTLVRLADLFGARIPSAGKVEEVGWDWDLYRTPCHSLHIDAAIRSETDGEADESCLALIMRSSSNDLDKVPGVPIIRVLPQYSVPQTPTILTLAVVGFLICAMIAWALFYRLQWGYNPPVRLPLPSPIEEGHHKIVLTARWRSGDLGLIPNAKRGNITALNCAELMRCVDAFHESVLPETDVVLLQLEDVLYNEVNFEKSAELLEYILAIPSITLVILSSSDPIEWVRQHGGHPGLEAKQFEPNSTVLRWVNILSAFGRESDDFVSARPLTDHQCHQVWTSMSCAEKLVLWQVSAQGLSNPKNNESLNRLVERGIVLFSDARFEISNAHFAGFLKGPLVRQEINMVFPPNYDNAWRGLSRTLIYLFVLGIFLGLVSLADWWGNTLLRIVTVGGAALPVIKLASDSFGASDVKSRKSA